MDEGGVYSDEEIKSFIGSKIILSEDEKIDESQIQPSSFDLKIGDHFYCLPYSSIPPNGEKIADYFKKISNYEFQIQSKIGAFLHKGIVYAVRLKESLNLPPDIIARANPKSSIGRIDLHVRLITENGVSFDDVPAGYKGELWLELFSRSFDIKLQEGSCLNQLRFMDSNIKPFSKNGLVCLNEESCLIYNNSDTRVLQGITHLTYKDSLAMTINIKPGFIGYVARIDAPFIDLSRRDLPLSLYFDKVYTKNYSFTVNPYSFYILNSREIVNIPKSTCAEMIDIDTGMGEFRGHYAGFFDPGFCAQAVLELRNYGQSFVLRDGQPVSGLNYFKMKKNPNVIYGVEKGSHYQGQVGPKFAKFFIDDF